MRRNDLQLTCDQCIINARSHSGPFLLTLVQSEVSQERERKKEKGQRNGGKEERGREADRKKKWERKERRLRFFFSVFAFTTSKFSLIPSVHSRAIDGEKKHFHMCKLASSLPYSAPWSSEVDGELAAKATNGIRIEALLA